MIISHNQSGICNRIKSWVSSMKIDPVCYVYWQENIGVRNTNISFPSFDMLFDNKNIPLYKNSNFARSVLYDRPDDVFTKGLYDRQDILKYYRSPYLAVLPSDNISRNFIKNPHSKKVIIDNQYNKTPEKIKNEYSRLFSMIKIKPHIIDASEKYINATFKAKNIEKLVTVHIRSWCDAPHKKAKWYNIQNFIDKMKELDDDDVKFFIAVDENIIIDKLKKTFKDKIEYYPRKKDPVNDMGSYTSQVEALIDLLILGKGKNFLATETSTFSEVAWWLGGCKSKVIKIGNMIYD